MQIKRYETTTLQEARSRIQRELGPNAIILSTKKISDRPPRIEVMAARDGGEGGAAPFGERFVKREMHQEELLSCLRKEIKQLKTSVAELSKKFPDPGDFSSLRESVKILLDDLSANNPDHLLDMYMHMINNGVSRPKAIAVIEAIKRENPYEAIDTYEKGATAAEKLIAGSLPGGARKERRIMALVGPSGVGKTTTLAKLAAHYSLEKKMKVGMITTDTYRIAATEQLKIYARIMGLPIRIASDKELFLRSVADFSEKEVILVDTPGRNQQDDTGLKNLPDILNPEMESVLLLTPTSSRDYLLDTADRFRIFNYERIILTKIDECSCFGSIYDTLEEIGKPVSHMTTGQNVPRDIEPATPEKLAKMILDSRLN